MRPSRQPAVYIMASARNGTLYIGVTSNLPARATQHREDLIPGFTSKHRCHILVYFEVHDDMAAAIAREKQLKAGSRYKKCALIQGMKSAWSDLYKDVIL